MMHLDGLNRTIGINILRPILLLQPASKGTVVVTFHNIPADNEDWFNIFISTVGSTYGFIDPKDFTYPGEPSGNQSLRVLLTFDDGFYSNRLIAERVLSKHNVKAIFFLTEGFIGLNPDDAFSFAAKQFCPHSSLNKNNHQEYSAMSWEDARWLISEGHAVGGHTRTHPVLSEIHEEEKLIQEVVSSTDRMEQRLGVEIDSFAFPFGKVDAISKRAMALARDKFSYIFSNVRGNLNNSPGSHFIYRQNIVPGDPLWFSIASLEGRIDWRHKKDRAMAKREYK